MCVTLFPAEQTPSYNNKVSLPSIATDIANFSIANFPVSAYTEYAL
jgi:hypothetical protein